MGENFFAVIFYSFYIFRGNYVELKSTADSLWKGRTVKDLLLDHETQIDMSVNGGRELGRRIHNYAAAWFSLVDHTRIAKRHLKQHPLESVQAFSKEYDARLNEKLKDSFENLFIKDLRRYVQHKEAPAPTLHQSFSKQSVDISLEFKSSDIEDFNWHKRVQRYIDGRSSVPVIDIIETHFGQMRDFYLWIQFRDHQLHPYAPTEIKETTFEAWKKENKYQKL